MRVSLFYDRRIVESFYLGPERGIWSPPRAAQLQTVGFHEGHGRVEHHTHQLDGSVRRVPRQLVHHVHLGPQIFSVALHWKGEMDIYIVTLILFLYIIKANKKKKIENEQILRRVSTFFF